MLKQIIKKLVMQEKYNSTTFIKYLNSKGAVVEESAYFVAPSKTLVDLTKPYLIEIGHHVTITEGCALLTHGFDWSVLKIVYGDVIGSAGKVVIKDNCFIGVNTIILKGCVIGENTIIGAGSVVCHDIPPNSVAAGNPCRVICTLEEYYHKRKRAELYEASELIRSYYYRHGVFPPKDELAEFFWLFQSRTETMPNSFLSKFHYGGENASFTVNRYCNSKPLFESYEDLCQEALSGDMRYGV